MIPVCRAQRVRSMDATVIDKLGVPGRVLMETAGRGAAEIISTRYPGASISVLCGTGNNGGDGWVVARWLSLWGHAVRTWSTGEPKTPDAQANRALAERMGLSPVPLQAALSGADVVVDALLGTGQRDAPRGATAEAVDALHQAATVVALDLPTGVEADTGQALGSPAPATLTVTFGRWKPGLLCEPGATLCGEVHVVDIGLDLASQGDPSFDEPDAWILEHDDVAGWLPALPDGAAKWDRGHVAILAGGGAAVLAAHGALTLSGLCTLLAPRDEWPRLHGLWPEVILAEPADLNPKRHDAVVIGPGLGLDTSCLDIWANFPGPVVADADALTVLAKTPTDTRGPGARVITPHVAEAGRLLGQPRSAVEADRFQAVETLTKLGTPLLKGRHTLVGGGTPWVNPTGSAHLATAGSGDVLAGIVGALLANGLVHKEAAATAAYLHGLAGEALRPGATASDLVAALPEALSTLADYSCR